MAAPPVPAAEPVVSTASPEPDVEVEVDEVLVEEELLVEEISIDGMCGVY